MDAGRTESPRASEFARRYSPIVRAYLTSRWRTSARKDWLDDAIQNVFVECFRKGGVLHNVREARPQSFRAFLFGVTRNIAMRMEKEQVHRKEERMESELIRDEPAPDGVDPRIEFERKWARTLIAEALDMAAQRSPEDRAKELFDLRFAQNLPIREIAARWQQPAEEVHRIYARARRRFQHALRDVVAKHEPMDADELNDECRRLLQMME